MSASLIIVCDWIPPEFGAVGQYQMARAREAAASGRRVTLIGLGQVQNRSHEQLGEGELTILRVARKAPDKKSLISRGLWALSVNFSLLRALAEATRGDPRCEIKVTGSPPFLSYLVLLWVRFRRRRVIYRITDFYPETVFAAGKALWLRPLTPLFHGLRRRADCIEALSDCQKRRLAESGVPSDRITVVRDGSPVTFSAETLPAGRPFAADDIVLLYSGNLGVAHDWRTFAEAYRRHVHEGPNRVRLWLNAVGAGVAPLRFFCDKHGLPVHVSPPSSLEALAGVLRAPDAHLVLLGDPFWGYVIPSKIYGCIESGRPCLYVGPQESDIHMMLAADPRHSSLRNGEVDGVVAALLRLKQEPTSANYQAEDTPRPNPSASQPTIPS